jgi:hypothetical protein
MNPLDYGTVIVQNDNNYIIQNNTLTINLNKFDESNEVEFFRNGISITKFIDKIISVNSFERQIGSKKYIFENNEQILFTQEMKTKFIKKLTPSKTVTNNQICMDIETYTDETSLIPYLICYYDGENVFYFGL